jgi:branched-subunit amino acid aminotransferase/4-amino-4-deoxychorismate lyase
MTLYGVHYPVMIEAQTFDLLETLKWTPDGGFFLLDRHLRRLERSARYFDYPCSAPDTRRALDRAVAQSAGPLRVRLLLARDGTVRIECAPLEPTMAPARLGLAPSPIDPADVFLFHKTTNRRQYDQAKRMDMDIGVDDVILWNPDGQVTESTLANVVAEIGGRKVTPPVACGLLAGTFREQLLEEGVIEEGSITIDELRAASRVWLVNSVREWWPAVLEVPNIIDMVDIVHRAAAIASTPTSASATIPQDANRSQR